MKRVSAGSRWFRLEPGDEIRSGDRISIGKLMPGVKIKQQTNKLDDTGMCDMIGSTLLDSEAVRFYRKVK